MKDYSIENQLVLARKFIEEDLNRAVACYEIVFSQKPDLMTEDDFIDLALAYEDLNEIEKGFNVYQALLDSFPESDRGYYGLGVLSEELEKPEEAIKFYQKAIDKNPDYFEAYFYMAGVYDDLDKSLEAIKNYKIALELNPQHYYTNLNLGSIYESLHDDDIAYDYFMKALDIDYHFMALFNLGVLAKKAQRLDLAIEYYEDCIRLNPEYGYGYLNWSLIYKDKNQIEQAIEILTIGIEATENMSYLYYHRACNYALLGDKDKCISDLQVALKLYPNFDKYMVKDEDLTSVQAEVNNLIHFPKQ